MTERQKRRAPRRRRARALLTVAAGVALSASIGATTVGCGDDTTAVFISNDMHIGDMATTHNSFDAGNPAPAPPDMAGTD
jgi:hypothetical protein